MKLYKDIGYPEDPREVDQSIVDILTSEEPSSLRQSYYDEDLERQETRSFGINYGTRKGDRSPVLRGFEFVVILYEIDSENNQIIIQPTSGQLSYDEDKIPVGNQFVFEGTVDDVLQEFANRGYHVVESESYKNRGFVLLEKTQVALEFLRQAPQEVVQEAYRRIEQEELDSLMQSSESMDDELLLIRAKQAEGIEIPKTIEEIIKHVEDAISEAIIKTSHLEDEKRSSEIASYLWDGTYAAYLRKVTKLVAELLEENNDGVRK